MAVKLRLRRMGRSKRPQYAVVAADGRSPRNGRFIEDLGRYEPLQEPASVSLKTDRVLYWLEQGAQPSETVRSLLSREGVLLSLHMRRKGATEEAVAEASAAHRQTTDAKLRSTAKLTPRARRAEALATEAKTAAERDAIEARARAEADARARAEADEARRQAAAERERAAEEARREQEAANLAQASIEAAPAAETASADSTGTTSAETTETALPETTSTDTTEEPGA